MTPTKDEARGQGGLQGAAGRDDSPNLGTPEWTSPEFRQPDNVPIQAEMSFGGEA